MKYLDLINIKCKYHFKLLFITILIFVFLGFVLNFNIYDAYVTKGYFLDDYLYVRVDTSLDLIDSYEYMVIDSKKYNAAINNVGPIEVDKDNLVSYQLVEFDIAKDSYNNELVTINIYYHKEKVIDKIKTILF